MLYSASDYQYVDTSNVSQYINGNILPIRNPNGNGASRCAYEDYLFMLEAYNERYHFDQVGQNNVEPAPMSVPRLSVENTNVYYQFCLGGKYIRNDISLPNSIVQLPNGGGTYLNALLSDATISNAQPYYYGSYYPYKLETWCNKFYNIMQYTRWADDVSQPERMLFSNWYYEYTTYYSNGWAPVVDASAYFYGGTFYSYMAGRQSRYNTERMLHVEYDEKMPMVIWPDTNTTTIMNVRDAKMYARVHYWEDGSTGQLINWAVPVPCQVTNNTISLPTGWLTDVGQQMANRLGKPYYTSAPGTFNPDDNLGLTLGDIMLVVNFDFPASFTGWNYTPLSA